MIRVRGEGLQSYSVATSRYADLRNIVLESARLSFYRNCARTPLWSTKTPTARPLRAIFGLTRDSAILLSVANRSSVIEPADPGATKEAALHRGPK
jgi:hypothetical protein